MESNQEIANWEHFRMQMQKKWQAVIDRELSPDNNQASHDAHYIPQSDYDHYSNQETKRR